MKDINQKKSLQILLVEDSASDAALLEETIELSGTDDISVSIVTSLHQAIGYCKNNRIDAVLLDLTLPDSSGLETVRLARKSCPDTAFVVLTGVDDEQMGVEAVRMGIQDYLVKGRTDGRSIVRAIRYAIERKQAQRERERLLAQLRAVIDSMDEGLLITDEAGNLLEMNPKARKIHEYTTAEQVSQHIKTFDDNFEFSTLDGKLLPLNQWPLPRVLRGEAFSEFEVRVHRKDTGKTWIGLYGGTPIHDKDGKVALAVLTLRDITRFKQMEEELRKSRDELETKVKERTTELADAVVMLQDEMEERKKTQSALIESELKYRELVEKANSIIMRCDIDGTVTFFNEFAQKFFGFSEKEIIGRNIIGTIAPHTDSGGRDLEALVAKIRENPEAYQNFESENMCRDGRRVWVNWTNKPIKDAKDRVVEILSVGIDITYRKQAEAKIQDYQSQLRSLTAELLLVEEQERRAVAMALHDSLGPLLAFSKRELGSLQKSAEKGVSAVLTSVSQNISEAIKQTRELTFDLSPPALYTLGFEAAVEELAERFCEEQKLEVVFENSDEPKPLTNHAKILLYRSIREVLINAAKHAEAKRVRVALSTVNNDIKIVVEDDGKGFDASRLDPKSGSKGFGLFSVRERLTHIDGTLNIQSVSGKGTKVTLLAPLNHSEDRKGDE